MVSDPPLRARLPRPLRPFHYCHIRQRHNCFSELQECLKKLDNTFSIPKSKTDWWAKNGKENSLHSNSGPLLFWKLPKNFDCLKIQKLLILHSKNYKRLPWIWPFFRFKPYWEWDPKAEALKLRPGEKKSNSPGL